MHWGTPFLLFVVPAAMELALPAWSGLFRPRRAVLVFIVIQLLLMARVALTAPNGAGLLRRESDWHYFDAQTLADVLHPRAIAQLGGPVRVISGPWDESGALSLLLPEKPLVLINGSVRFSPWIPADVAANCGMVELSKAEVRPEGFESVGAAFPSLHWRVRRPPRDCDGLLQ